MFDHYLALRSPEQSGLLGWSALPHAPVLSYERSRRAAGRLRRGTAGALVGLAERLDPQASRPGPLEQPAVRHAHTRRRSWDASGHAVGPHPR